MLDAVVTATATVATSVLLVAGVGKVRWPLDAADAMRVLRLPTRAAHIRALGVAEVLGGLLGLIALCLGWPTGVAVVALAYVGFSVAMTILIQTDTPLRSCGCLGKADSVPSRFHLAFNIVATAATTAYVLLAPPPPAQLAEPAISITAGMSLFAAVVAARALFEFLPHVWQLTPLPVPEEVTGG